jgi:hypothetical protein
VNEEVNQKNITCSNTCNNVDYVTIETLLGDAMTYEEYINSLNKRNLVSVDRLQNNWDELKKWLSAREFRYGTRIDIQEVLNKMQELEGNND